MRVLFLTPWYPDENNPNHGIFVRDQAVALLNDHQVCVVCSKVDYEKFGFLSASKKNSEFMGVHEHRINVNRSFPIFNQVNYFIVTVFLTWKIARKFKPELIHGNIGYPGGFWSWCMSTLLRKPFVVTEHTRITNNFRSSFHKLLTIFPFKRASQLVAVSNLQADEIFSFVGKRPMIIPNIIDFEKFNEISSNANSVCQIGFLGSLHANTKGLDILLKAVAGIKGKFILHIGGDGILLDEYKALARQLGVDQKCVFLGFVPHNQVPAFMKQLHFFVSASRYESFGMVMVEAMACGLPVVATKNSGPSDFITSENGILVERENISALQNAMENMMANYRTYDPVAIRKFAVENYSAERFIRDTNRVYASLANAR